MQTLTATRGPVLRAARQQLGRGNKQATLPVAPRTRVAAGAVLMPEYGYIIASAGLTAALLQWQAIRVAQARRTYRVEYPQMYVEGRSEEAVVFNCTQRAHQNTLETAPAMLAMVALMGLVTPIAAAVLNTVWVFGRVLYTTGYSSGDPKKRIPGAGVSGLAYLGAIIASVYLGLRTALVGA